MLHPSSRRTAMLSAGLAVAAGFAALAPRRAEAAGTSLLPGDASTLRDLAKRLDDAPRRRDFKTVPMILDDAGFWDHAALSEVLAAELTNHLIPGVVLTPGVLPTLPELQLAGFVYAR